MAEFHWKTWGIGFLHRCMLKQTGHSTVSLASLSRLGNVIVVGEETDCGKSHSRPSGRLLLKLLERARLTSRQNAVRAAVSVM